MTALYDETGISNETRAPEFRAGPRPWHSEREDRSGISSGTTVPASERDDRACTSGWPTARAFRVGRRHWHSGWPTVVDDRAIMADGAAQKKTDLRCNRSE